MGIVDLKTAAEQAQQQELQRQAFANQMIIQTAIAIYAQEVCAFQPEEWKGGEEKELRLIAQRAKIMAPYLAEAFGLCKVNQPKENKEEKE